MSPRRLSRDEIHELYDTHGRVLLAYACSLVPDVAAAEDLLHQVFARLLKDDRDLKEDLKIVGPPRAYLYRAIRNAALNYRRDRARETDLAEHAGWLEAPPGFGEAGIALEQALASLPQDQREIVVLHVWGQMTFQEIAIALDISPNTAASRYRYGLGKLREALKPLIGEDDESRRRNA